MTQADGTHTTLNVTIGAGENVDDIVSAINTETNGSGTGSDIGEVIRARVTNAGQLEFSHLMKMLLSSVSGGGAGELIISRIFCTWFGYNCWYRR